MLQLPKQLHCTANIFLRVIETLTIKSEMQHVNPQSPHPSVFSHFIFMSNSKMVWLMEYCTTLTNRYLLNINEVLNSV